MFLHSFLVAAKVKKAKKRDTASRLLFAPYQLPVGIMLSLIGGPFFIWLLLKQRKGRIV